ncbi:unnamed protein product [Closterium sp. NIES-53]
MLEHTILTSLSLRANLVNCYRCVPLDPGIEAAALGASESSLPGTAPAEALHTFTLDSGASRCFFRDSTTLTTLPARVPVRLADPSGGPVVARSSTVLPCPAVPSGSLSGLQLPSFSTNLVSAFGPKAAPCSCRLLSHQTLLWHHRLGHPSLPCLRGMHSRLLGCERYFLLVVDDYTRYTTVFPLRSKGEVVDVLIPWIRAVRLQLREPFRQDLPVLRLHSDRGGEFSSDLLRDFCRVEGILQSFTLPASPQQNRIAERCIGLVMEVARTSMIHAAAPHFLWLFAVRYTAHELNLCFTTPPRVVSSPLRKSRLTSRFPFTVSSPNALLPPPPLFLSPEALTLVKSELQKRHTWTDLAELRSYLGLQITRDRIRRTITLTQSHMVHQVLQRFGFQFSSPQPTPLSTGHSLSAPPSDESVEPSGLYPELVGCLMYLMMCTRPDLAYSLSLLARYVAPDKHRKVHWDAAKRVLRYLCSTSGMGLVLGGRDPVVLIGHADASWVDDSATQRSSQGYTFSLDERVDRQETELGDQEKGRAAGEG